LTLFAEQGRAGADSDLRGVPPDLKNPDESGVLTREVDFRSVHAAMQGGWFETDPRRVPAGSFEPAKILKQTGASA
jgi:hypothetical protein